MQLESDRQMYFSIECYVSLIMGKMHTFLSFFPTSRSVYLRLVKVPKGNENEIYRKSMYRTWSINYTTKPIGATDKEIFL